MIIVTADDVEQLVCQICRRPFRSLETAWLLSPPTGGEGRWVPRRCSDGAAGVAFGLSEYRLRRGDFVLNSMVSKLWAQTL